jgi:Xaa-Pro aminopeptidase
MDVYQFRVNEVKRKMKESGLNSIILFPSPNLYYITGFKAFPEGRLLLAVIPSDGEPFFFAPKLYYSQIHKESWVKEIFLWTDDEDPYPILRKIMKDKGLNNGKIAVDDTMWAEQLLNIVNILPNIEFVPVGDMINSIRLTKTEEEIENIKQASKIVDKVIGVISKSIKAGMTEREVAALMEYEMRKQGSEGPSFETIVGSGPNSALPHYSAGERELKEGEFVVLDFGATYMGYCSDTTRTLCIGDPTPKMVEVYNIVKEAQEIGVKSVKPGIKAMEVDKAVRDYITQKGYGEYFTHRTGHGLGLQVHEEPYISSASNTILHPGMVFSIEPGIYIEGEFGVRIEDIVVVTETGCERLNNFNRELIIIK